MDREDNQMKKAKKRQKDEYIRIHIHTGRYRVSHDTWYCCMFERKHSAARRSTAGQGAAPYGTPRRCAALLSNGWAELSCEM